MVVAILPPVDPADRLAAAEDPKARIAETKTSDLTALVYATAGMPDVQKLLQKEFGRRVGEATTSDLLSDEFQEGGCGWTHGQVWTTYLTRVDARPEGVVQLYQGLDFSPRTTMPNDHREFLRVLREHTEKNALDRTWVWTHPVAELMTAAHYAEMYEVEKDVTIRCWLAAYAAQSIGTRFDFLFNALEHRNRWHLQPESLGSVVARLGGLAVELSDKELRDYVSRSLATKDSQVTSLLLGQCLQRNTIGRADYQGWLRRIPRGRTDKRADLLSEGLERCNRGLPFEKLLNAARDPEHSGRSSEDAQYRIREAAVRSLRRRLPELCTDDLVTVYRNVVTLREEVVKLYLTQLTSADERATALAQVLKWGADMASSELQDLLAFEAIGLGARAAQVMALYPATYGPLARRTPDVRVFVAYSALAGSRKGILLRWVRANHQLLDAPAKKGTVQRVLARQKDITAKELARLVDINYGSDSYNRMVFEVYANHPDADPSLMIGWFEKARFVAPETLAAVLRDRFEPSPADVCRLVIASKSRMDFGDIRRYAVEYFSKLSGIIEVLLDQYPKGPVNEVLVEAYKLTDRYKEAARVAAAQD